MLNKNYLLLYLVTIVIFLGMELFTMTILISVFNETGSTLQAVGALICRTLPAFFLGPIAGVLADRMPKKWVLFGMNGIRMLLTLGVYLLLQRSTELPVFTIYLILTALSTAEVFHNPARLALIPSVVPYDKLVTANSAMMIAMQMMLGVSTILGAYLLESGTATLDQIALGIMGLFTIATISPLLIETPYQKAPSTEKNTESIWESVKSGWSYLNQHPIAKPLTIMEAIEHVPHGIWSGALMLAFTTRILNGTTTDWGYVITSFFIGMVIGSVATLLLKGMLTNSPGWLIIINALASGVLTLAYAQSNTVLFAIVIAFFFGPPFAIRDVAQDTLLQATVDEGQLGRVFATREMIRSSVFMSSAIFFAWISDFTPLRAIYFFGGIIYLLTALYAIQNKALRKSKMP